MPSSLALFTLLLVVGTAVAFPVTEDALQEVESPVLMKEAQPEPTFADAFVATATKMKTVTKSHSLKKAKKRSTLDKMKEKQRDLIKTEMAKPAKIEKTRRHIHQAAMSASDAAATAAKKAVGELRSLRNSAEHGVAVAKA